MKKAVLLLIMALSLIPLFLLVNAEEYTNYQEIVFDNDDAVLLKDYTSKLYEDNYEKLTKAKFIGWKHFHFTKNEPVEFVSETKLRIYNNGFSTIKHEIELTTKEESKFQISASGSVGCKVKGGKKKFDGALDADIKASVNYSTTLSSSETYEFVIIVDPKTYVTIVTRGKGEVNNGVAKHYLFWIETKRGGWETFTVNTEYYEIIKERI
ncbi:MAG: hypothetical protein ACOX16_02490 [Candidatus Izemoplasmatales bacterium]|jgi:hypothetical protein